jgi:transcriptional regulator with XRE-family HTH domain
VKTKTIETAKTLRTIRKKVGISQNDLADKLGFSSGQTISNIEGARCAFPRSLIKKVSKALNADEALFINALVKDYKSNLISQLNDKQQQGRK